METSKFSNNKNSDSHQKHKVFEKSLLVKFLGENPVFKIVDFLIDNKGIDLTKKDIIDGTGISRASLFNHWGQIEQQQIVIVTRKFGKTKLYTLNSKNPIVKKLLELESLLIGNALDSHKAIEVSI
ncbi:hypothetical protein J4408_01625 [Candidatus Pacearchaeota archaeon]|nr:hypothetical protein [Candidatus Pacearchaeota archaeon]